MSKISSELPTHLYSADQIGSLENIVIKELGINSYDLMLLAGASVFTTIKRRYPQTSKLIVFVGSGNNAGDGYVVAAIAKLNGIEADVIQLCEEQNLKSETRRAFEYASSSGVSMYSFTDEPVDQNYNGRETLIVDAILGTGLNRPIAGRYQKAINAVNSSNCQ